MPLMEPVGVTESPARGPFASSNSPVCVSRNSRWLSSSHERHYADGRVPAGRAATSIGPARVPKMPRPSGGSCRDAEMIRRHSTSTQSSPEAVSPGKPQRRPKRSSSLLAWLRLDLPAYVPERGGSATPRLPPPRLASRYPSQPASMGMDMHQLWAVHVSRLTASRGRPRRPIGRRRRADGRLALRPARGSTGRGAISGWISAGAGRSRGSLIVRGRDCQT